MIVRTTAACDIFINGGVVNGKKTKGTKALGLKFKDDCYFHHVHRVLAGDGLSYESETHYPINKDEDTVIPDSVANSTEFQQYFTLGYLTEII